ncbi:hypothetical protein DV515_00015182 [Chloebia gouldiae]|uniref:Uncharacterized protein n=1 Tax=Chloebia gouldiae TaxID=44316 RepID=A0A3L8RWF8_CHLGU|nr:hypothetical protein DV515_00015182 [Chloebia gouldiae]
MSWWTTRGRGSSSASSTRACPGQGPRSRSGSLVPSAEGAWPMPPSATAGAPPCSASPSDLVLFNLIRAGILGLRGGSAGAQLGTQVPTKGWDRGVDPLPTGAPGAEGVLFPKQAGTRVGGPGWAEGRSEIPPATHSIPGDALPNPVLPLCWG